MKIHRFNLKPVLNALCDMVCPRRCLFCAKKINSFAKLAVCDNCSKIKIVPLAKDLQNSCFDKAIGALKYEGTVRKSMHKYKFKSCKYYSTAFAKYMYDAFGNFPYFDNCVICCVPVSRSRNRAYSQTEEIAAEFCRLLGNDDFIPDLLIKTKDLAPMSSMNRIQRANSVNGVFDLNPLYSVCGKNIVIIDDILTSGATADECAAVLKMYGAMSVFVVCACYD